MDIKKQKAIKLKLLSDRIKRKHQIVSKCDFFSLFSIEVMDVNKKLWKLEGWNNNKSSNKVVFFSNRKETFYSLLFNLVRAKWGIDLKCFGGESHDILLLEKSTKIQGKKAERFNEWFFNWDRKKKSIFINIKKNKHGGEQRKNETITRKTADKKRCLRTQQNR